MSAHSFTRWAWLWALDDDPATTDECIDTFAPIPFGDVGVLKALHAREDGVWGLVQFADEVAARATVPGLPSTWWSDLPGPDHFIWWAFARRERMLVDGEGCTRVVAAGPLERPQMRPRLAPPPVPSVRVDLGKVALPALEPLDLRTVDGIEMHTTARYLITATMPDDACEEDIAKTGEQMQHLAAYLERQGISVTTAVVNESTRLSVYALTPTDDELHRLVARAVLGDLLDEPKPKGGA